MLNCASPVTVNFMHVSSQLPVSLLDDYFIISYTTRDRYRGHAHGRTGRKKLGGRKEICPTFPDCARPVPKKLFVEQINFGDHPPPALPPPSPKIFRSVYHFMGPKIFPDLQTFLEHQTPFPYITKLTTKLT
jgi:hypothetical protein